MNIRSITQADHQLLWNFLYLALYVPAGHSPINREIIQEPAIAEYAKDWEQLNDIGFIYELNNAAVGLIWLSLLTGAYRGYGYWNDQTPELSMSVLPEYRRKGIGSALLSHLLKEIGNCYDAISLSVNKDNPAKRFYERFGFKTIKIDETSAVMLRKLTAESK